MTVDTSGWFGGANVDRGSVHLVAADGPEPWDVQGLTLCGRKVSAMAWTHRVPFTAVECRSCIRAVGRGREPVRVTV